MAKAESPKDHVWKIVHKTTKLIRPVGMAQMRLAMQLGLHEEDWVRERHQQLRAAALIISFCTPGGGDIFAYQDALAAKDLLRRLSPYNPDRPAMEHRANNRNAAAYERILDGTTAWQDDFYTTLSERVTISEPDEPDREVLKMDYVAFGSLLERTEARQHPAVLEAERFRRQGQTVPMQEAGQRAGWLLRFILDQPLGGSASPK